MARITINTRDLGPLFFWCPNDGGYVYMEPAKSPGTTGKQICNGGGFRGDTLGADELTLPRVARYWNKQRRAYARTLG